MKYFDTIVAISTAMGNGGIGIVRISGDCALQILSKIFRGSKKIAHIKSHTTNYGYIFDGETKIDEVLVNVMIAPKTYTKEDVVEINCHGGAISVSRVLDVVLKNGARIAETGEFTKRAFLNGRIDLSQAEAVIDIINAKTTLSQQNAIKHLDGKLSEKIKKIRNELILLIAQIEASIDYPEHDMESFNISQINQNATLIINQLQKLYETSERGKIIKEGIETVILGKPNVGKSSLLNALLNEERAIVTNIPGTTRDILQEYINIKGIPLKIIDTAGIRDTIDEVEKIGVEKSKKYANSADLILFLLDYNQPIEEIDIELLELIKNKKTIVILNKIDLKQQLEFEKISKYIDEKNVIKISLAQNIDIEEIYTKISELFYDGQIEVSSDVLVTSARHKNLLQNAINSLTIVQQSINLGFTEDFLSIDLQNAYSILGEITGDTLQEDIIDKIFSEFCLGK